MDTRGTTDAVRRVPAWLGPPEMESVRSRGQGEL